MVSLRKRLSWSWIKMDWSAASGSGRMKCPSNRWYIILVRDQTKSFGTKASFFFFLDALSTENEEIYEEGRKLRAECLRWPQRYVGSSRICPCRSCKPVPLLMQMPMAISTCQVVMLWDPTGHCCKLCYYADFVTRPKYAQIHLWLHLKVLP